MVDNSPDFFDNYFGINNGERTRLIETQQKIEGLLVSGDPDGVISAAALTFGLDVTAQNLYVNVDGGTTWKQVTLV